MEEGDLEVKASLDYTANAMVSLGYMRPVSKK